MRFCSYCDTENHCQLLGHCAGGVKPVTSAHDIIAEERERCARLCEDAADHMIASAKRVRDDGTFNGQQLTWRFPFVKSVPVVASKWEQAAKDREAVADLFKVVARGIRLGWKPLGPDPTERIDVETTDHTTAL